MVSILSYIISIIVIPIRRTQTYVTYRKGKFLDIFLIFYYKFEFG